MEDEEKGVGCSGRAPFFASVHKTCLKLFLAGVGPVEIRLVMDGWMEGGEPGGWEEGKDDYYKKQVYSSYFLPLNCMLA